MKNPTKLVATKLLICASLILFVAFLNYVSGYEASLFLVYLLAIAYVVWEFGPIGGYIACFVTVGLWIAVDILSGHHYSNESYRYLKAGTRLTVEIGFVYLLSIYRKSVEIHRLRLEKLRRLIPLCHGCGKILWRDGTWKTIEEALEALSSEVAECPGCQKNEGRQS